MKKYNPSAAVCPRVVEDFARNPCKVSWDKAIAQLVRAGVKKSVAIEAMERKFGRMFS
jgi:hypothetical protein